jgi:hypothetical protein
LEPLPVLDGVSALSLPGDPGARVISDTLNNQADPNNPSQDVNTVDANNLSDFGYAWGQFIDHDMDLTPTSSGEFLSILADPNDPSRMGNQTFERSSFDPSTGTSTSNPRQQVNAVSSFLDLSQVYGSTAAVANALRTFSGGQLKTSPGNMLPYNNTTYFTPAQLAALNMANDAHAVPQADLFATGISLATDFFDPNVLNPNGVTDPLTGHVSTDIDAILEGDADGDTQAMDLLAIRDVRDLLFANGGLTDNGPDLIARDIERARDDGIGTYNDVRAALGLPRVTSFAQSPATSRCRRSCSRPTAASTTSIPSRAAWPRTTSRAPT